MSVITVSVIAFTAVLVLLSFMAVIMTVMTRIFPAPLKAPAVAAAGADTALECAIAEAVTRAYPGARVSKIQSLGR